MSDYEDTPTPLSEMKDQQEVRLENGAEGVIHYYGSPYNKVHNKELRLEALGEEFAFSEEMIEAAGLKLYKKMPPKDCVIVWEDGEVYRDRLSLGAAWAILEDGCSPATIYRLVPISSEEE